MLILQYKGGTPQPGLPTDATIWVRGDSLDALGLNNGDPVSTWQNEGTTGGSFGSGNTTTYHTNVINGKSVVRSPGNDTLVLAQSLTAIDYVGASEMTAYIVQYHDTLDALNGSWQIDEGNSGQAGAGLLATYSDALYFDFGGYFNQRLQVTQPSGWDTAFHIVETWRDPTGMNISVDGVTLGTNGANSSTVGASTANVFLFGYDAQRMTGDIAEFIVYDRALTPSERTQVHTYLSTKYGI